MNRFLGVFLGFLFLCLACNSRKQACERINSIWNNPDKSIEELDLLFQMAQSNPNCLDSLVDFELISMNGFLDKERLEKYYFGETIDTLKQKIKINILLENSASMWGYFEGQTDCELTLAKIMVHSGYLFGKENLSFYYITDTIRRQNINGEVTEFLSRLEPSDLNVGNVLNTRIADVMKTVINTSGDESVSLLISDCIYSVEKGKSKTDNINFEWALIEEAFLNVLRDTDLAVSIHKYMSNYKGTYYVLDRNKDVEWPKKVGYGNNRFERPYYIISVGEAGLLKATLEEIDFKSYPGYLQSYLITLPEKQERLDYSILNSYKIGSFRPDRSNPKRSIEKARKESRGPDKGVFQYSIAANLKNISVEEDYLVSRSNYIISGDYKLVSVREINQNDLKKDPLLSRFTHLLSIQKSGDMINEEVSVSLKREAPAWIDLTHTEDDYLLTKEYQFKTRGFKNLIEGIESAFYQAQKKKLKDDNSLKYHFTLTTQVSL